MQKGMSSFQIIVLSIFGAFTVGGVLIFAFFVGSNSSATIGQVVMWGPLDETAFGAVLRELAENDGRFRQVTYVGKNEDTYLTELTNALAAGNGPDLFIMREDDVISEGVKVYPVPYEQLSRESFRNTWVEAADPFLGPDGVVGIPFAVDPLVLYWNRDMLATGGVSQPPTYWDELPPLVRAVTKRDDGGSIQKSAIAFGEYANVNHAKTILGMLILQAGGRVTVRDGSGQLTPALATRVGETGRPAESALTFFTQFSNPSSPDYTWNRSRPEARIAFAQGDLALYIGPASEEAFIRRLNPNLNFAIAPSVPQVRTSSLPMNGGHAYAFTIPKASANPQGALTVAYLLGSDSASRLLGAAYGFSSARRTALAEPAEGNEETFRKMALLVRTWEDPNSRETDRVFRDMIESVTSGAARAIEAVQRAEQAMRELTSI